MGGKRHKILASLQLIAIVLSTISFLFVPQKTQAFTADQVIQAATDVGEALIGELSSLDPIQVATLAMGITSAALPASPYATAWDISMKIMDAADDGIQFTNNDTLDVYGTGITLKRLTTCDHDYFCYVPDTTAALIGLASPVTIAPAVVVQGLRPGIVVSKDTKEARFAMFLYVPEFTLNIGAGLDTEVVANMRSLDRFLPVVLNPFTVTLKNQEKAPYIYSVKKVNLSSFPGLEGKILFEEPPSNPEFFKKLGHVSYFYFGTAEETLDIDSVEKGYNQATSSLVFGASTNSALKDPTPSIIPGATNALYTNTKYQVSLFGAKGYTDCATGEVKEIPGTGVGNPAGCTEEYKGDLFFTLDESGKITVVNARAGEEVNNGKSINSELFISGWTLKSSPLDKALSGAIKTLAGAVGSFIKTAVSGINGLLDGTTNIVLGEVGKDTTGVEAAWTKIRNIALTLLIMALIIIAFANVLQIDIEHYGLNRMIPRIIISIIMAYLSWIIVTFFFDFAKALQDQAWGLLSGGKNGSGLQALGNIQISTPTTGDIVSKAGAIIVLLILLIGILICLIVLWFSLLMRVVVLSFLLAVAPLAFILNIVPFTSNLYKKWWSEFFKWMFMGPVAVIIIALGSVIASGSFGFTGAMSLSGDSVASDGTGWNMLIGLLIFGASIYLAATLPLQWGGKIMSSWSKPLKGLLDKAGKSAGSAAWNQTGGRLTQPFGKAWKGWRGDVDRKREMRTDKQGNSLLNAASFGRHGTDPSVMKAKLFDAEVAEAGKRMGVSTAGQPKLVARYASSNNDFEKAAIEREMASQGDLEKLYAAPGLIDKDTGGWIQEGFGNHGMAKDQIETAKHDARVRAGKAVVSKFGSDQILEKAVKDNQAELLVAARNSLSASTRSAEGKLIQDGSKESAYAHSLYGGIMAGQNNKSLKEKRMNIAEEIDYAEAGGFLTEKAIDSLGDIQSSSDKARSKAEAMIKNFRKQIAEGKITAADLPPHISKLL